MNLHQITKLKGQIDRVTPDWVPTLELHLDPNQRVVSVEMEPITLVYSERKTVDWKWTAYIDTDLGEPV